MHHDAALPLSSSTRAARDAAANMAVHLTCQRVCRAAQRRQQRWEGARRRLRKSATESTWVASCSSFNDRRLNIHKLQAIIGLHTFIRSPYLHLHDVGQRSGQAASCELRRRRRLVQQAGQQQRQPPLRPAVQRQRRLARLRRLNSLNRMFMATLLRFSSILCCLPQRCSDSAAMPACAGSNLSIACFKRLSCGVSACIVASPSDAVTAPPRPPAPAGFMCIAALACSGELMWLDNSGMQLRGFAVW